MNYMKQVAEMLGVEIGEEFRFKSSLVGLNTYNLRFTKKYLQCFSPELDVWVNESTEILCDLLSGEFEVVKLPKYILDEKEKEYLSAVIRPFRDRVADIVKRDDDIYEYIVIAHRCINGEDDYIYFPFFKKGTMYKGMKVDREYSLKELDL